jgi:alpha-L-fucosidase
MNPITSRIVCCLLGAAMHAMAAVTPQAWYRMGETGTGAEKKPLDASGNGRDFIYAINGAAVSLDAATPAPGSASAYVFNGANQGFYATGYDAPEDNVGLEVWARSGDLAQSDRTIFGTEGKAAGLQLAFDVSNGGFRAAIAGISWVGTGYMPASTSEWVHLALVRDTGVATFYVNGVASGSSSTAVPANGASFHLAVNNGGQEYFKGSIDELRIFTFAPGAFSLSDLLYVPPAPEPAIVSQPTSAIVQAGGSASFTVGATGAATLQYQWYRSPGDTLIDGANGRTLTTNTAGGYYVIVSNTFGSVTSDTVTLTIAMVPTPSTSPGPGQQAQINRKYGMFCHFGINTFADLEWTDGTLPATLFNPTAVNADQWVLTAKAAGMRYLLLTTKHHDGFCLWNSAWTTYDVASSSVPSLDVVKLVSEACARHGIRFAMYYSLWDRHEPSYNSPDFNNYILYMQRQLTELMSGYGPVAELWLDGGWEKPNSAWNIPSLYHVVKTLQPDCQITVNWTIGLPSNPDAMFVYPDQQAAGYPIRYFPSDFRTADPYMPKFPDPKTFSHNSQTYYLPLEATVTLSSQNRWFHHTSDTGTKPLLTLENLFNTTTAQNNLLVLNAAPNRAGVLLPGNVTALTQLAYRLGLEPDRPHPVNLANAATVTAQSTWASSGYEPAKACDENPSTRWSAAAGDLTPWLEMNFGTATRFDRVIVNEYGESNVYRCTAFSLQSWNGAGWDTIHTGTTFGESIRIDLTNPVVSSKLRLQILGSTATVSIWMLKVQDSARPNPALSSYRVWQEQNFSLAEIAAGSASANGIAAGDGVANAVKFALGIGNVRQPWQGVVTPIIPGDTPLFSFYRAGRDARYVVQSSENLADWSDLATDPGAVGTTVNVPFPTSVSGKSFLRLMVDPEP